MLTNILVATDASPASNRAINFAADLAGKYDATLHLIYAVREMQLPPELKKMAEVEKIAGARSDVLDFVGKKILSDAEVRAQKKGANKIKTSLEHGDPATAIMRYAKKRKIDLIVLGTRGLNQVKGMLMGSVSRKVTNLSDVSCLIIR
ncbi:MAG: universal stress protein [Gammaproteobacteria bacterium]|jgi:nucleotide-binding universal stress UspA family protein|nr:universal stress protein [Gammaproteobacteria bacterium]MDX2461033.1 universal stress protein [Gammaproteobacteria bacterium]